MKQTVWTQFHVLYNLFQFPIEIYFCPINRIFLADSSIKIEQLCYPNQQLGKISRKEELIWSSKIVLENWTKGKKFLAEDLYRFSRVHLVLMQTLATIQSNSGAKKSRKMPFRNFRGFPLRSKIMTDYFSII